MNNFCRTCAALTISFVAAVAAGCSSPAETPPARAQSPYSTPSGTFGTFGTPSGTPSSTHLGTPSSTHPSTRAPAGTTTPAAPVVSKPRSGKFAYCAPLAVATAFAEQMPKEQLPGMPDAKQVGKLLRPAIAAATAEGKTEVAEALSLWAAAMNTDLKNTSWPKIEAMTAALKKGGPVILKDCGINLHT